MSISEDLDHPPSEAASSESALYVRAIVCVSVAFLFGMLTGAWLTFFLLAGHMNKPILLCGVGVLASVGALSFGHFACFGCVPPIQETIVAIDPHVVTNDQCAVLELRLDSGVTKDICLTADELQKVLDQ